MNAQGMSFSFLQATNIYVVPFFQRAYVWDENNWEELLDNLNNNKSSFFGSIITKIMKGQNLNVTSYQIIDGQQRLTTFSILFKVLDQLLSDEIKKDMDINITGLLRYRDYDSQKSLIKITHSKNDNAAYNEILNKNDTSLFDVPQNGNKLKRCYNYFINELSKCKVSDLLRIYKKLLDEKCIVSITLEDNDHEQAIFDTINNAGVKLTSADTIKNSLFQRALDLCGDDKKMREKVINSYANSWETKFSDDEEKVAFWDQERSLGRIKRTNLEILLHSFALIKDIYDPNNNKLEDLPNCYKDYISTKTLDEMFALISEIEEYANTYMIIWEDYNPESIDYADVYNKLLLLFDKLDMSTFNSYLLYCAKNFSGDVLKTKLKQLETYLVRNVVCGGSVKNYNKECYSLIHGGEFSLDKELMLPKYDNASVKNGLNYLSINKYATYILFIIELHRRDDDKCKEKKLNYAYTLEHVMPQDLGDDWEINALPVYADDGVTIIDDEEKANEIRHKAIYSIGNMTLLSKKLNSSIKNKGFARKIDGDKQHKGIAALSSLFITTTDIVNPYKEKHIVWDERTIKEREKKLYQEFIEIWPLN